MKFALIDFDGCLRFIAGCMNFEAPWQAGVTIFKNDTCCDSIAIALIETTLDAHEVPLWHVAFGREQAVRQLAVVRQKKQPLRIFVEASDRKHAIRTIPSSQQLCDDRLTHVLRGA